MCIQHDPFDLFDGRRPLAENTTLRQGPSAGRGRPLAAISERLAGPADAMIAAGRSDSAGVNTPGYQPASLSRGSVRPQARRGGMAGLSTWPTRRWRPESWVRSTASGVALRRLALLPWTNLPAGGPPRTTGRGIAAGLLRWPPPDAVPDSSREDRPGPVHRMYRSQNRYIRNV